MNHESLEYFERQIRSYNLSRHLVSPEGVPYVECEDDLTELSRFAASFWGPRRVLNESEENWWFIPDYFGALPSSEAGFVTNGIQYFDIDTDGVGVVELHINARGKVFGVQPFYMSSEDGRLRAKHRTVFWD